MRPPVIPCFSADFQQAVVSGRRSLRPSFIIITSRINGAGCRHDPPTSHEPRMCSHLSWKHRRRSIFSPVFGHQHVKMLLDAQTPLEARRQHRAVAWKRLQELAESLQPWDKLSPCSRAGTECGTGDQDHLLRTVGASRQSQEIAKQLEGALEMITDAYGDTPPIPSIDCTAPLVAPPERSLVSPLADLIWLLEQWGFSRENIQTWCHCGITNLKASRPAFG